MEQLKILDMFLSFYETQLGEVLLIFGILQAYCTPLLVKLDPEYLLLLFCFLYLIFYYCLFIIIFFFRLFCINVFVLFFLFLFL